MLDRLRLPGLGGWSDDPLWASFYDWSVEHPRAGGAFWRLGIGSDLRRLYDAAAEIGRQPAGSSVLDIPCGGGVALRGLRPGQDVRYVAADISTTMLERTMSAARERGLADQVEPRMADVGDLPFDDGEFDLVVSFTGLHCFPDPHRAVLEMGRVTHAGGVLSGSALLNTSLSSRAGLRSLPVRHIGRLAGMVGPSATGAEVRAWLAEAGFTDITLEMSGAIGYFRGVKDASADLNGAG
jgi:ubiquinone/menaquinone biosynthesis C-methylase UbiE